MADARLKTPALWLPLPPLRPTTQHLCGGQPQLAIRTIRAQAFWYTPRAPLLLTRDAGVAEWQTRDSRPRPSGSPSP